MHLQAFTYTRWNEVQGFHILLKFSTHITSRCEPSSSFRVDCNCLKSIKYGGKGGTLQKNKSVGGGKRFSRCRKDQFEINSLTITCSCLECCWTIETENIIIKKGRRHKRVSVYVVGWVRTSTSLSIARSFGPRPRMGRRRGREAAGEGGDESGV